ncbi:energy transducer TonB [Chryseobacterium sp. MMS23-Vi53]|uniref:energy transducer TonB n=1 Tax=Chryseobacterium sp. MMS23-Vi53 TaxID=3386644 RepID=UPI0039E72F53
MKHVNQNQEFRFNEVLFEHRNKEYGAYVLRNESDKILTKALFVGVSLLAAISLTPVLINAFKSPEVVDGGGYVLPPPIIIDEYDDTPPPATVVPPTAASAPVKTFDNTVPTPSRNAPDTKTEEIPDDAVAGLTNNFKADPAPPNTYVPTTPTIGTGPVINTAPPTVVPKEDPNKIVDSNDLGVEASFVGGVDSFRNKVMNNFDGSGFDSGDVMKTTITFIVEKDGTISGIKANGADADFNSEAVRTIKSIRGKWVPAKNKQGDPVRSYFKFPISMKFDN